MLGIPIPFSINLKAKRKQRLEEYLCKLSFFPIHARLRLLSKKIHYGQQSSSHATVIMISPKATAGQMFIIYLRAGFKIMDHAHLVDLQ
ncbi:hypothetical protein A7K93_08255 [Candidatus Methylacidiphilum fumarolicum]|uniref:Uncharacterized protein n=2 Tax=Candidatus Methylacidiphilum fumarolicum TaxID=591154 RepID=I0K0I6_METFB|nr:hypothetical protein [Candidatus Methylacidiphilum fumarolicum]MBW6414593.1 hypothetical protein [Candidatus Methylacidiphilum fumarolicum]TFE65544.1 hypothetical protein A7K73_02580 [Candidatus Methylacidiphilum fumarolicum]TFE72660.1 hypothetical protein A7K93_08255 [Candidatus Methylacidiphilum fumarolicum]TFE75159.1 hypothetical protein A7K72_02310 [Candidatus Methylacidiphilum fumarolicum]TFE77403.1 hypothetical protein A7D33_04725 [Candidatus Methylacidiphilum fumarolicum]